MLVSVIPASFIMGRYGRKVAGVDESMMLNYFPLRLDSSSVALLAWDPLQPALSQFAIRVSLCSFLEAPAYIRMYHVDGMGRTGPTAHVDGCAGLGLGIMCGFSQFVRFAASEVCTPVQHCMMLSICGLHYCMMLSIRRLHHLCTTA